MYKKLSKSKEILAKLPRVPQNKEEELRKMQEMNSYMEEVRRDYIYKEAMSEKSAENIILTS